MEDTLFGLVDKVQIAVDRLREHEPPEGYYGTFSGGKDSVVIKALSQMAGINATWHYAKTTCDPPELVHFIKDYHKDVEIMKPKVTMWQLIPKKLMPPTRMVRYCCDALKEQGGDGRIIITGVRHQESSRRAKRKVFENDSRKRSKWYVNPIIDWSEGDVWEFIHSNSVPFCSLYNEGFTRLGCVGCPMSGSVKQRKEFERWPKIRDGYIRAFERMVKNRKDRGMLCEWETGEDVMAWYLKAAGAFGRPQCDDDQGVMFE